MTLQLNMSMRTRFRAIRIVIAALLWLAPTVGPAALAYAATTARPMLLEHLSTLEGLPQGTVYVTLQDSQGFVWFGTEDGLVRYDGHEIYRYASSPYAKDGLPGDFIFDIVEDKRHNLWIAVKGGGVGREGPRPR